MPDYEDLIGMGSQAQTAATLLDTASTAGAAAAPGATPRGAERGGDERPLWTDLDHWLGELSEAEAGEAIEAESVLCAWVEATGGGADLCHSRVWLPPDMPSCPATYALTLCLGRHGMKVQQDRRRRKPRPAASGATPRTGSATGAAVGVRRHAKPGR